MKGENHHLKVFLLKFYLILLIVIFMTSSTQIIFSDPIKSTIEQSIYNENPTYSFDLYNQVVKNEFIIRNVKDIAALFSHSIQEIECNYFAVKNNVISSLGKIISIPKEKRTFDNTILEYDRALAYFRIHGTVLSVLKMTHPDERIRKKAEDTLVDWASSQVEFFETNREIYCSFIEYQNATVENLNDEREHYLSNALLNFNRAGLGLQEENYIKMKELQKQIALLSITFHTNIAEDASVLSVVKEALMGVDADFIDGLLRDNENYLLPCDYPSYYQIMTNCTVEETRKNYLYMFNNRAFPHNMRILEELINCRDTLAKLLGYESYVDFDIATEMAQSFNNVESFLDSLATTIHPRIKTHWDVILQELPESISLTNDGKIKPWDVAYVANKYMQNHFKINKDEIAEYFPLEKTMHNLLRVYESFFDVECQIISSDSYWDLEVQTIEVRQKEGSKDLIGYILLDLFPRKNKYSHCCCNSIIPPMSFDQGQTFEPAVAIVIANFSKSTKEKTSLLKHHEVITLFHELGHAFHAIFGKAEMPTKAAYNTKIDFIETPSQLLEEWMWDKSILQMVSSHYLTGNSLPESIIDNLIQTRNFIDAAHEATAGNSDHEGTELHFARLAIALFKEGSNKNIKDIKKEICELDPQIVAYDANLNQICTFIHLTSYGCKYYSYLWSKALAKQIYQYIKLHGGLLEPSMGKRYISKIIGRGGSLDPSILMADFLEEEMVSDNK